MDEEGVELSVEFLCDTFRSLNTTEQEHVDEAERRINILFQNHLNDFMALCATIIISETYDNELFVIGQSVANLKRAFSPRYFSSLDELRKRWGEEVPSDIKHMVRDSVVRAMMFPQEHILTNAASLFSYIFTVDLVNLNAFEYILNLLSGDYGEAAIKSGLIATKEICNPDYTDNTIKEVIISSIDNVFEKLGDLYANIISFPIDIGMEILSTLSTMETSIPDLFRPREVIEVIVNNAVELLPVCQDAKLFELMFIMLERLIEANYARPDFYEIFDWSILINTAIQSLTTEQGSDFKINGIMFFNFLLQYEKDIYQKNKKISSFQKWAVSYRKNDSATFKLPTTQIYNAIVDKYCCDLVPILLTIASVFDEGEQGAEDIENPDIAMAACSALRYCAFLNREAVYLMVDFWKKNLESDSWTMQHFLVVIPYLLCSPGNRDCIRSVITTEMFPFILQKLRVRGQIPRILDSGFYTLVQVIKVMHVRIDLNSALEIYNNCGYLFGLGFLINESGVEIHEVEPERFEENSFTIISMRVASTIDSLFELLIQQESKETPNLFTISLSILNRMVETSPENDRVIRRAIFSLSKIILNAPDLVKEMIMSIVLPETMEEIQAIVRKIESNTETSCEVMRMISKMWIIQAIFKRFWTEGEQAKEICLALFEAMQHCNMEAYHEDFLKTLIITMRALNGTDCSQIRENIESYIDFAYETSNASLVVDTIKGMTELIIADPNGYQSGFGEVIDRIMTLLLDEGFPTYPKPQLMRCLGRIMKTESDSIEPNLKDQILDGVFQAYQIMTADDSLAADETYFNDVYVGLLTAFNGFLVCTKTNDKVLDRKLCRTMIKSLTPLAKSTSIQAGTVIAFLDFLDEAIPKFGRRYNIILNWLQCYAILLWGIAISETNDRMGYLKDRSSKMITKLEKS